MNSGSYIQNVKPLMFVIYREGVLPLTLWEQLERSFWPIDFKGPAHPFTGTQYYEGEFGDCLMRRVISFRALIDPGKLGELKNAANTVEFKFANNGKRLYNLDMGYMDTHKLVLASFKPGPHKVAMGRGIYADMLLQYSKGAYTSYPWAFKDFKEGVYNRDLLTIREKYKVALKRNSSIGR